MNRIVVSENDAMSLWYYPDKKIVHHKFQIPVSGKKFRTTLSAGTVLPPPSALGQMSLTQIERRSSSIGVVAKVSSCPRRR